MGLQVRLGALVAICLAACGAHGSATPAPPSAPNPEFVSLHPYPKLRTDRSQPPPDWCWDQPHPSRPLDYRTRYAVVLVERAVLSALVGDNKDGAVANASDPLFGRLQTIRSSAQEAFVIGPATIDPRDLPTTVHSVAEPYPAVVRAWDQPTNVNLVDLAVLGYVQDPAGNDALRIELTIRGVFGEPKVSRNFGAVVDLCVVPGNGQDLTWYARVSSES